MENGENCNNDDVEMQRINSQNSSLKKENCPIDVQFWKALEENDFKKLEFIILNYKEDYDIFFRKYRQNDMSCFEKLCSTRNADRIIFPFFSILEKNNIHQIKTNYLSSKVDENKLLKFSIDSENFGCFRRLCQFIGMNNIDTAQVVDMMDEKLKKVTDNKVISKLQYNICNLIKSKKQIPKREWKHLFDLENNNYCEYTKDILIEFILDIDLDESMKACFMKKISKEANIVITLFKCIQNNDEKSFVEIIKKNVNNENEKVYVKYFSKYFRVNKKFYTLLQLSCEKGLKKVVKILLEKKCDSNLKTLDDEDHFTLAFTNRHKDVLKILKNDEKVQYNNDTLLSMLKHLIHKKVLSDSNFDAYNACLAIFKNDHKVNLQLICSLCLQLALKMNYDYNIKFLLKNGASINIIDKNKPSDCMLRNKRILESFPLKILETHLDESISCKNKKSETAKINFAIFKPVLNTENKEPPDELRSDETLLSEMKILLAMTKIPDVAPLIKHPVIQSFLHLKWERAKWLMWGNFCLFVLYCLCLVTHFYCDFPEKHFDIVTLLLIVSLTLLVTREAIQCYSDYKYYFRRRENWLELTTFALTLSFLCHNFDYHIRVILNVITIFLAFFQSVILMSKIPKFSLYYTMLQSVVKNFLKFTITFITIFVYFTITLHKLFRKNDYENEASRSNNTENFQPSKNETDTEYDFFHNIGRTFLKTLMMFTGELDAGTLDFELFPYTSNIAFGLFLLIVTIVLYNFLNGLAISDIQAIKNDAEILSLVNLIKALSYLENVIFGAELLSESNDNGFLHRIMKAVYLDFRHYAKLLSISRDMENETIIVSLHDWNKFSWKSFKRGCNYLFMSCVCRRIESSGMEVFVDYTTFKKYNRKKQKAMTVDKNILDLIKANIVKKFENKIIFDRKNDSKKKIKLIQENLTTLQDHSKKLENQIQDIQENLLNLKNNQLEILNVIMNKRKK